MRCVLSVKLRVLDKNTVQLCACSNSSISGYVHVYKFPSTTLIGTLQERGKGLVQLRRLTFMASGPLLSDRYELGNSSSSTTTTLNEMFLE